MVTAHTAGPAMNPDAGVMPRVLLVGGGRLVRTLLRGPGLNVNAILLRDAAAVPVLAALAPAATIITSFDDIDHATYDTVWILTRDSSIESVARELALLRDDWQGVTVLHSSGATSVAALAALAEQGAATYALHPNGSFTGDLSIPPGTVWGISDSNHARLHALRLIGALAPKLVVISEEYRALYHAAASVAGNYSVTLFAIAADLYERAGIAADDAREIVAAFISASAERAASLGAGPALTGPIARGDTGVVANQYEAILHHAPEYLEVLAGLALRTAMLAGWDDLEKWRRVTGAGESEEKSAGEKG